MCTCVDGYEKGVQVLRQQHSEDMAKVAQDIFSHYYIAGRNALTIKLIVSNYSTDAGGFPPPYTTLANLAVHYCVLHIRVTNFINFGNP